jgi:hypothetical protein
MVNDDKKQNCWEFKNCGREKDGPNSDQLGVCPVCQKNKGNKTNKGKQGGRVCWAVVGSLCGGTVQGSFAEKLMNCIDCEFFKSVKLEEGEKFKLYP